MMFISTASIFGSALWISSANGAIAVQQADSFVDQERGFLRDVAKVAVEEGLVASDATASADYLDPWYGGTYVQLSDEEILANNKGLADFFEMIEDDEKYAKWEKEEMPQLLLEIQANANAGRTRQKQWARKAMVKSEIEACNVRNYWKEAAYWAHCRRWEKAWFINICTSHGCHGSDNLIWPLCHRSCNGWSDDGTRCWKKCDSQSTTPTACGHTMCSADTGACIGAIVNMVVSIASMLASVFPAGKVAALASKMAKAATKAAMKALLKQFAKEIAKNLLKKTKRKVQKFMKAEIKGAVRALKDEAVESILQEAAEAFAIERAKKEVGYSVPDIEEIARACDPIGVMDVIDAFNLASCDDTVLENFPACTDPYHWAHSSEEIEVMLFNENHCCFGYTPPEYVYISGWGWRYKSVCNAGESYVTYAKGLHLRQDDGSANESVPDWLTEDDDKGDEDWPEGTELVDVLYEELPMTGEDLVFCEMCVMHQTCSDNEIEGADLTLFDQCTAKNCCSPPEGFDPSDYNPVDNPGEEGFSPADEGDSTPPGYSPQLQLGGAYVSQEQQATKGVSCHACDTYGICGTPMGYAVCSQKGCCVGMTDPNEPDWIPEPLPDDNTTETATGEITDAGETTENPPN